MDSLSLYYEFCKNGKMDPKKKKFENVDRMIKQIYEEISVQPFSLNNSSFLCEVIHMLKKRSNTFSAMKRGGAASSLSMVDTYAIIAGLRKYMDDNTYMAAKEQEEFGAYLFNGSEFQGSQINEAKAICKYVMEIKKMAAEKKTRTQNNQEKVQTWHEQQTLIQTQLMEMQPSVSKLLEGFMSFSDKVTENYVLQFARQQIELFDLIFDNYKYHKKTSEESGDENYINAVANYEEFMYSISDNLAVFGIEEIISEPDTPFDGKIHEADGENFSARTAVVKESVRSGFKYKDIIMQKEKVMI